MHHRKGPRRGSSQWRDTHAGGEEGTRGQWRSRGSAQPRPIDDHEKQRRQQQKETVPEGACQTMCPARELRDRERQNRLHHFEMLAGTEQDRLPRGDPSRAVKEYSRPAAGKDSTNPSDLRTPEVLLTTVCYLIDSIVASPDLHPWTEIYSFVFDRLRSVKQDMIIQRVSAAKCVAILELTIRFLIYASYRLCGEPLRLYDPCINDRHLQENLSWLLNCYATEAGPHPHQEEFEALGLLYNLGSARATQHILELPAELRSSPDVSLALSINRAFLERNPVRLLRLAKRLTLLETCALHRHLVACRRDLLLVYSHGFSSRNCRFPHGRLAELLDLDTSLTVQICEAHGQEVDKENQVVFSKAKFAEPEQDKLHCKLYHIAEAKKNQDVSIRSIIHGCAEDF